MDTDCTEDWGIVSREKIKWPKQKYPPHNCVPRGGLPGTPFRRFCKVCGKAFSKRGKKNETISNNNK